MTYPTAINYRHIGPTTLEVWRAEFARVNSPFMPLVEAMHHAAGPHSALCLAQMWKENQYGSTGKLILPSDNNPLGLRPWEADPEGLPPGARRKVNGQPDYIEAPDGGKFLRFVNPWYCVDEWRRRLFDRSSYKGGIYTTAITLDDMLSHYAPAGDKHPITGLDNADIQYAKTVRDMLNKFSRMEGAPLPTTTPKPSEAPMSGFEIGNRPLRIAIGTGHANTSGGNAFETAINKKVANELIKLAKASDGFEVRCYTPGDGLGSFPGPLDTAAATVRSWWQQGWRADILHEIHQEGLGRTSVRGGFFIYPDSEGLSGRKAGGDFTDLDVKAAAGEMARIMVAEYGGVPRYAPSRGMSEAETGVGGDGYRLGVFGAWSDSYLIENTCQFISEGATYTNPTDLALMKRADYPRKQAIGILKAYAYLAKSRGKWTYKYAIGTVGAEFPTTPATGGPKRYPIAELQAYETATKVPYEVALADGTPATFVDALVRFPVGTKILQLASAGATELRAPVTEKEASDGLYIPFVFTADDGKRYGYNFHGSRIPMAGAIVDTEAKE